MSTTPQTPSATAPTKRTRNDDSMRRLISGLVGIPTRAYLWREMTGILEEMEENGATRRRLKPDEVPRQLKLLDQLERDLKQLRKTLKSSSKKSPTPNASEEKTKFSSEASPTAESKGAPQ